jgi:hypothetical protein
VLKLPNEKSSLLSLYEEKVVGTWQVYARKECVCLSLGCELFENLLGENFEYWFEWFISVLLLDFRVFSQVCLVLNLISLNHNLLGDLMEHSCALFT